MSKFKILLNFSKNNNNATGAGKVSSYVEVLRQLVYIHSRPEDLNSRVFGLMCTELKDHFASNQLSVKVC